MSFTCSVLVGYLDISSRLSMRLVNKNWKNCVSENLIYKNQKEEILRFIDRNESMKLVRLAVQMRDLKFLFWVKRTLSIEDTAFTILCFRADKDFISQSFIEDTILWKQNIPKFSKILCPSKRYIPVYFLTNNEHYNYAFFDALRNIARRGRIDDDSFPVWGESEPIVRYFMYRALKDNDQTFLINLLYDVVYPSQLAVLLFDFPIIRALRSFQSIQFSQRLDDFDESNILGTYCYLGYKELWDSYQKELDCLLYITTPRTIETHFPRSLPSTLAVFVANFNIDRKKFTIPLHFLHFFGIYDQKITTKEWSFVDFKNGVYKDMKHIDILCLIEGTMKPEEDKAFTYFIPNALKGVYECLWIEDWMVENYIFEFGEFLYQCQEFNWLKRLIFTALRFKIYRCVEHFLSKIRDPKWTTEEKILLCFEMKDYPQYIQRQLKNFGIHYELKKDIRSILSTNEPYAFYNRLLPDEFLRLFLFVCMFVLALYYCLFLFRY